MEPTLSGVGTLDKVMAITAALTPAPMNLAELVRATGLSRATAHRLASAMAVHGLVRRDDDGRFTLGLAWVRLAGEVTTRLPLAERAGPVLDHLRSATGESAQLYVREGDQRVCVAALDSPQELRTIVGVGAALPLDRGSAGAVLRSPSTVPGWTASVGERTPGVASVSAPVVDESGRTVAAISVSGPIERLGTDPGARFGPAVLDAAQRLSDLV